MKCCVNIACALRWGVTSVESFSIVRVSPYIGNISGAGDTPIDGAH